MIASIKEFIHMVDPQSDTTALLTVKELLDQLNFVQGEHPKKFANYIGTLIEIVQNYVLEVDHKVQAGLFQLVLSSMEIFPSILRKNPERVSRLFDIIYRVMGNIPENISENWLKPPLGYDQDNLETLYVFDSSTAVVCEFRNFADRIGCIIGYMKTIQIIESKASVYYNDGDWRFKAAVLMCFSQLSEELDMDKIGNVLKLLHKGFSDGHPKVRFAAVQALGQLSDDLKPDFQNKYFNQIMPIILNGFKDNVERVSSHWMACMTNFIQDYSDTEEIIPYVNQIFESVCKFIENGMIQSKQNALATLSSLVTVPSLFDKFTIKKPFQICHSILQAFPVQNHQQLINQAIECLTITASSQPYALIKQYIPFLIQILNLVCEKISPEYFTAGWHRLCLIGHKFLNWQGIFKKLLSVIKNMQNDIVKSGFDAMLCTVDCFKEDFYPFTFQTLIFLQQSCENGVNDGDEQVASAALNTIQQIIKKAKPTSPDNSWDIKVKTQINNYCQKVLEPLEQNMYQVSQQMMESIKELLNDYSYLYSEEELGEMYKNFWVVGSKLQEKKISFINNELEDMGLDEENEQVDQDLKKEKKQQTLNGINSIKLIIPDIIHAIMKKMTNPVSIINDLLQHISNAISNTLDQQDFRYAIYFIDNLLDDYDYSTLKDYWDNIYNYLAEFALNPDATVRNSASYGIGILAEKTPFQLVSMPVVVQWIQLVKASYIVPKKESQSKKIYGHCQDNCVAVVGKILKKFNKHLDLKFLYQKWLQVLPLRYDHQENRIQIRYLCQVVQNEPQMIIDLYNLDQGIKRLRQILKILAQVTKNLRVKKNNKENVVILRLCRDTLKKMMEWQIYKEKYNEIICDLSKGEKFQIQQLLTNELLIEE